MLLTLFFLLSFVSLQILNVCHALRSQQQMNPVRLNAVSNVNVRKRQFG